MKELYKLPGPIKRMNLFFVECTIGPLLLLSLTSHEHPPAPFYLLSRDRSSHWTKSHQIESTTVWEMRMIHSITLTWNSISSCNLYWVASALGALLQLGFTTTLPYNNHPCSTSRKVKHKKFKTHLIFTKLELREPGQQASPFNSRAHTLNPYHKQPPILKIELFLKPNTNFCKVSVTVCWEPSNVQLPYHIDVLNLFALYTYSSQLSLGQDTESGTSETNILPKTWFYQWFS